MHATRCVYTVFKKRSVINLHLDRQEETLTDIKFRKFRPATLDEIRALILACNNSSCLLDPVPTWLL